MNTKLLFPLLTLAIGVAVGWVLKPQAASSAGSSPAHIESAAGRTASGTGRPELTPRTPADSPLLRSSTNPQDVDHAAEAARYAAWRRKSVKEAAAQREQAKLRRFGEAIGLDASQDDAVKNLLAQLREQPHKSLSADPMLTLQQQAADFDAKLRAMLTPEQQQRLDEYQRRQMDNRADARAYNELAEMLQRVDMGSEQSEKALEVLRQRAVKDLGNIPPAMATMLDAQGIPLNGMAGDPAAVAIATTQGGVATSARAMYEARVARQRLQAGENISRMAQILSAAQLSQYRAVVEENVTRMEQALPAGSPVRKDLPITLPEPPPEPEPEPEPEEPESE